MLLAFSLLLSTLLGIPARSETDILPTKLQITVRDELGNAAEGVQIQLYKTQEDFDNEQNQVGELLTTDAKGRVTFTDLEPVVYFVIAEKGDLNNFGAGTKTDKLEAKKVNRVTIIIS